jgi:hypothetical protein
VTGIPPSPKITGFTPKMYAIARKVVNHAITSVLTSVFFSSNLKSLFNIKHLKIKT